MDKAPDKARSLVGQICVILAAGTILYFFFNIANFSVNIPNSDDFDVYLKFLNNFLSSHTLQEKTTLLFLPHNEHYLIFPRLLSLGILELTGEVNFVWLNILGCLALLVFPYALWTSVHIPNSNRTLLLLCVCLMVFHPQYVEAVVWATAAVSNLWVIGFVLLSLICANKKDSAHSLFFAFLYGLLGTITLGNGVLIFLVIGFIFLANQQKLKGAISIALFGALVYVMHTSAANSTIAISKQQRLQTAINIIDYWLTFLGSSLSFYSHYLGLASGVVFMSIFFLLCYLRYDKKNPIIFGLLLFCVFTALAQALVRSQINMDFSYTTSRYKIVSILALSGVFIGLVESAQTLRLQTLLLKTGVIISTSVWFLSYYYNLQNFEFRRQWLEDSLGRWHFVGAALDYQAPSIADQILRTSIENGIYKGMASVKPLEISKVSPLQFEQKEFGDVIVNLENINLTDDYLFLRGWAFLFNQKNEGATIDVVLTSTENQYRLSSSMRLRLDVTMHHQIHFNQGNLDQSGFQILAKKNSIQPGEYRIGVIIERDHSIYYKKTTSTINVGISR